jgi:hypothetical protein
MINNGQTLELQLTTGAYGLTASNVTIVVGSLSDQWTATTLNTGCAGPSFGGYCWYAGAVAGNCDAACSTHGGCAAAGLSYGEANNANCLSILSELSLGAGSVSYNGPWVGLGCFSGYGFRYRDFGGGATCAASYSDSIRACACNA